MTPNLVNAANRLGLTCPYPPIVLAGVLAFSVLLVQAVVRWFESRNI
jgi:hypothetical protein